MPGRAAFTMLELLLVLAVLGAVAAVSAARLGGLRTSHGVETAAHRIADQAWRARHLAVSRSRTVRLTLDPAALSVQVEVLSADGTASDPGDGQAAATSLHDSAESMTLVFAADDHAGTGTGSAELLFQPDARCDLPGTVTIAMGGRSATVHVDATPRPPVVVLDP